MEKREECRGGGGGKGRRDGEEGEVVYSPHPPRKNPRSATGQNVIVANVFLHLKLPVSFNFTFVADVASCVFV
jgi:hypothetical protein